MADKIRINTNSLARTRENINNQLTQLNKEIQTLNSSLRALSTMWEGDAHNTFHTEFQTDVRRLETLVTNLKGIVTFESNAEKEYNNCEKQVSSLVSSIRV